MAKSSHSRLGKPSLLGQLGIAGAALAAVIVASQSMQPVYVGRAPVVQRLVEKTWRDSTAERAPWAVAAVVDSAIDTPQFEADRAAFAADLVRTGRVDDERADTIATFAVREAYKRRVPPALGADTIATFAVREAYKRRVPPALVFGVMLTENSTFKSRARSNVGAQGLMQVYGKVWVPTLGKVFGRDLTDDQTNLRYGVHILSHYVYTAAAKTGSADVFRKSLLRYNGCVRGTNTKGCHRYPDKVRAAVEAHAVAQCGTTGFAGCVERPLQLTLAEAPPRPSRPMR